MPNILVADDNENIRKLFYACLVRGGYRVFTASDGTEALDLIDREHIDLMIADIMMPGIDGYDLTKDLRASGYDMPILMITAKESIEDKKKGFNSGTDDYMVKPVDTDEMLLRVAALLRRAGIANERRIILGGMVLDQDSLKMTTEKDTILLPKKEFYILFKLLSYPEKIFTRHDLMDEIWGMDNETDERTIDVHIKRLREKLSSINEFRIVTVRGLGYKAEKCI